MTKSKLGERIPDCQAALCGRIASKLREGGAAIREGLRPAGTFAFTYTAALKESASAASHAALIRKGAKRYVAQARLLDNETETGTERDPRRPTRPMGMHTEDDGVMPHEAEDGADGESNDQQTKEQVNYRYSDDENRRCERCTHFRWKQVGGPHSPLAVGGCERVAGLIRKVDTCDLFKQSSSGRAIETFNESMKHAPKRGTPIIQLGWGPKSVAGNM